MLATVIGLGQLAGAADITGDATVWNRHEWFPSLVASSIYLGCLPDGLGPVFSAVYWVPSDVLGEAVLDLAFDEINIKKGSAGARVIHVRNPRVVS
ncbi:hypothetical protein BDP81DRAFT_117296 [Colletotrichum phormii]|uniref:Uncharacterized protein n=1 Tax=Colletotrichum phormii TaxID=359342 RepID=A0AAI9ZGE0_9PEZI|nr:uncharacterized protein BDP81DRAFT_117296 [Colletotrichum phormii]KAK1623767.1 hypothetical protein BDP81DRAFT_117296 [Colletotrichum phormii]